MILIPDDVPIKHIKDIGPKVNHLFLHATFQDLKDGERLIVVGNGISYECQSFSDINERIKRIVESGAMPFWFIAQK